MAQAYNEEKAFGEGDSFKPDSISQGERRGSTTVRGRKMSRIGPPPTTGVAGDSDSGSGDEITRLVEMEAENAIKYRT